MKRTLTVWQLGVVAVAMIGVGVLLGLVLTGWGDDSSTGESAATNATDTPGTPMAEVPMEGRLLGDASAPVKLIEWGNYK